MTAAPCRTIGVNDDTGQNTTRVAGAMSDEKHAPAWIDPEKNLPRWKKALRAVRVWSLTLIITYVVFAYYIESCEMPSYQCRSVLWVHLGWLLNWIGRIIGLS